MEKLDPQIDGASPNIVEQNIKELKKLFPEIVTEGKVNFEVLSEVLGDYADDSSERYSFNWNGKSRSRRIAQTPSSGTLRPCPDESVDWDTTKNLFIEGDNLEVLKLLQKSYSKKVKMIYIDPPYNTGKEFIYPDKFQDNLDTYLRYSGQIDDEGFKVSANVETSGRYHTNWLNMMYPRLRLARNLLRDDGVIFISIDDKEVANLRKICDEIFGEENFIINLCHKSRASVSNDKIVSANHNHILVYARDGKVIHTRRSEFGLDPNLDGFNKEDERGKYKLVPVDGPGGASKGNPHYTFLGVTGYFRFSKDTMEKKHNEGRVVKVGENLQQKLYLEDAKDRRTTTTSWWDEKLYTSSATTALKRLMGGDYFDNPKHIGLVKKMANLWLRDEGDLVLDFFSGSASTAHAVFELNIHDNVPRQFILVQLPEPCSEKSEAARADYRTIADIGKERMRRVIMNITKESPDYDGDLGFKVFKLASSNIISWDADFDTLEHSLINAVENIKPERGEADVLYEILLKYGLALSIQIEHHDISGVNVAVIGAGALVVCLADDITLDTVEGIASLKDELQPDLMRVVFKDAGFKDDVVKTNAVQILRQRGIEDVKSL